LKGILAAALVCVVGGVLAYNIPTPEPRTTTTSVWNPNSVHAETIESDSSFTTYGEILTLKQFRQKDFVDTTTIIHIVNSDVNGDYYTELVYLGRLPGESQSRYYTVANYTWAGWGLDIDGAELVGDKFIVRLGSNADNGVIIVYFLAVALTLVAAWAVAALTISKSRETLTRSAGDRAC